MYRLISPGLCKTTTDTNAVCRGRSLCDELNKANKKAGQLPETKLADLPDCCQNTIQIPSTDIYTTNTEMARHNNEHYHSLLISEKNVLIPLGRKPLDERPL